MSHQDLDLPANEVTSTDSLREQRKLKRQKMEAQRLEHTLWRDALGLTAALVGVAWLVTLISYNPTDPSALFTATSRHKPDNLLGRVGANVAAYSVDLWGVGSFFFPFFLFYFSYLCFRRRKVNDWFFQVLGGGTIFFALITFLGSFRPILFKGEQLEMGGTAGTGLWRFLSGYLAGFGTYLLLAGTTALAILVATQLSIRDIANQLMRFGRACWRLTLAAIDGLRRRREAWQKERARDRIIKRELQKMEDEQQASHERVLLRDNIPGRGDTPPDEDDNPDEPAANALVDPAPKPARGRRKPPAPPAVPDETPTPAGDGIKVNQMKQEAPAAGQDAFSFVKEMEKDWTYPGSYFFDKPTAENQIDEVELREKAKALESKLGEFSVTGNMKEIHPGPVVTTYEFRPDAGIKYSRIVNLTDDLCLALATESIRIDRMPGRSSIGIEAPNNKRELITFREMVESEGFQRSKAKLLLCLGKTIDGTSFFTDLAKMPHLLIAGQTGSGKSVGINAMVCSILMRARPDEVKLIMIDPKMVEMGIYADIPHLLTPVVTDPNEAANALKWAVAEMENRYKILAQNKVRNLEQYNRKAAMGALPGEEDEPPPMPLPQVVVIIDELADLMMVARGEVEESIARLAQKSRAIGIHLILATQRPSVDIITGVIKSNLPSRLAYRVAQRNDSRIILDSNGAERLLGKGDALFLGPGTARLVRIHAPFLAEGEVLNLVKFLRNQGEPVYDHQVLKAASEEVAEDPVTGLPVNAMGSEDDMYDRAARLVVRSGQASVSYLQRKLKLGYNRAARLIDQMEVDGIVGPNVGSKARDILVPADYFDGVDGQLR